MIRSLLAAAALMAHIVPSTAYTLMELVNAQAPFEKRDEQGIFGTITPQKYQLWDGSSVTMPPHSMVIYGGSAKKNDSWISSNGVDWYMIGGVDRVSGRASPYAASTFIDQKRTCDTFDPSTGRAYLLAGAFNSHIWTSNNGSHWQRLADGPMPGTERPSCAVDSQGVVYMIGGYSNDTTPTNSVWYSTTQGNTWIQATASAPFPARGGHDSIAYYSAALKKDIVLVTNGDQNDVVWLNDVWASSDRGTSWARLTAVAPFAARYDSELKHNPVSGALVLMGGDQEFGDNLDDLWASLDHINWGLCAASTGIGGREDHSAIFDSNGHLMVIAGGGNDRDVYRSTFSFNDINAIAANCNLTVPACGTGLRTWPGQPTVACDNVNMRAVTLSAPWQKREESGIAKLTTAQTYAMPTGGSVTFGAGSLVLYGGKSSRNDVWVSMDMLSWVLIGGTSQATTPAVPSAYPHNTFVDQSRTCDTYDRRTGRAYLIAGTTTSNVWTSSNMSHWEQRADGSWAGRERPSCAVDDSSLVYMIGGYTEDGATPKNDVWTSADEGRTWQLRTAAAPFPSRGGHDSIAYRSAALNKQIVMVTGGDFKDLTWYNDIWASSDSGVSWTQFTANAPYVGRYDSEWKINPKNQVIVLMGGDPALGSNLDDMWASLDGGLSWGNCAGATGSTGIGGREDHSAEFDVAGYFVVMAGGGNDRDIWRSSFSFDDVNSVASACGLRVPTCGTGLHCWPGSSTNPACCPSNNQPQPQPQPTESSSSSSLGGGAIAGIVIGSVVGAALLCAACAFFCMSSKGVTKKSSYSDNHDLEMSQSNA